MNNIHINFDLYGLYVYLTYVYICIHDGIKVDYPPYSSTSYRYITRVPNTLLRQAHKTTKSHLLVVFTSPHTFASYRPFCVSRDISRVANEL